MLALGFTPSARAAEGPPEVRPEDQQLRVTYHLDGQEHSAVGRVLAEDAQGGVCLQTDEGELLLIQADELQQKIELSHPFKPVSSEVMASRLQNELGEGFQTYTTPHYVVAYSTSREYARWLSSLLERLHKAFVNYWERQGFELSEPEFPLVVVVYANEAAYRKASAAELGGMSGVVGYYSLKTNRVSMYDLSGAEQFRANSGRRTSLADINQLLRRPAAAPLVATIVHEATHQIAFNSGLMARYADLPLWLVEGMAIYFEAPDLSSGRGWRGIGKVNYPRLQVFRNNLPKWKAENLRAIIENDQRLRDASTAADAYADAWALNYFLIKQRPDEFTRLPQGDEREAPL